MDTLNPYKMLSIIQKQVLLQVTSVEASLQEDFLFDRFIGQTTKCKTSTRYTPRF